MPFSKSDFPSGEINSLPRVVTNLACPWLKVEDASINSKSIQHRASVFLFRIICQDSTFRSGCEWYLTSLTVARKGQNCFSNEKQVCARVPLMKIHRRNFLLASSAALLATNKLSFGYVKEAVVHQKTQGTFSATGKQVTVFTTAAKTDYRISRPDMLSFKPMGQPK